MRKALMGLILAATVMTPIAAEAQRGHRGDNDRGGSTSRSSSGSNAEARAARIEARNEARQARSESAPAAAGAAATAAAAAAAAGRPAPARRRWRRPQQSQLARQRQRPGQQQSRQSRRRRRRWAAGPQQPSPSIRRPGRAIPTIRACAIISSSSAATSSRAIAGATIAASDGRNWRNNRNDGDDPARRPPARRLESRLAQRQPLQLERLAARQPAPFPPVALLFALPELELFALLDRILPRSALLQPALLDRRSLAVPAAAGALRDPVGALL